MSRLTAVEAVVGHRRSHRLPAQGRRGRARADIGYPSLSGNTKPPALARRSVPDLTARIGIRPEVAVTVQPRGGNWFTNGGWYPLVTLPTFGLGSFVPFTHAANRLNRPGVRAAGIGYSLVPVVAFVLLGNAPDNAVVLPSIVVGAVFAAMIAAASQLIVLSRQIGVQAKGAKQLDRVPQRRGAKEETKHEPAMDPALARALDARAKREQARALAAADPLLAQDLHIGRPDLDHDYDDGGLVDLNNAPAATIASVCGIKPADAEAIVAQREERGAFANVDELLVLVDLPVSMWDRIRDRAVLLN